MAEGEVEGCPSDVVCLTREEALSVVLWAQRMIEIQRVLEACDGVAPAPAPVP